MLWWIAIIGLGAILKFIYWIADCIRESNEKEKIEVARELKEKEVNTQRLLSSINNRIAELESRKSILNSEIKNDKEKQKEILNRFTSSIYTEQVNFSKSENTTEDEFYGVDVHSDFCDEIYSIKERRCPNCKADNPYWENISDFE